MELMRSHDPTMLAVVTVLMCTELSFAFALGSFYVFHCTLFLCGVRTYDLVVAFRKIFSEKPQKPKKHVRFSDEKVD